MMRKKNSGLLILLLIFIGFLQNTNAQTPCGEGLAPLFGLTTESVDDLNRLLPALQKIKEKCVPVLRVVFQPANSPQEDDKMLKDYVDKLEIIRGHEAKPKYAYILGLLVDSESFYKYDDKKMRERAQKYADALSDYVDIWEAGNEVNGDWVGWQKGSYENKSADELEQMRMSVGARIKIVYETVWEVYKRKGKTPKFALNLYFNDSNIESKKLEDGTYGNNNCLNDALRSCKGECLHDYEMFTWAYKYLKPQENKLKFDYVLFSFYKDDCEKAQTDPDLWVRVFTKLSNNFNVEGKTPKVGFGEIASQCYCSKNFWGKPKKDDNQRRVDKCCRTEQFTYIIDYYQTLHQNIKTAIEKLSDKKPDYIGGFFYWYFYQDATDGSKPSNQVLNSLIKSAEMWK
ncbi:MAG: hypothetical protein WA584_14730 [Pyrinomonadaceae bacterium]